MAMISETTLAYLSTLTYQAEAKQMVSWLPLAGIYWDDEMPDLHLMRTIPENDRHQIYRLFGIRVRIWKGLALSDTQQQLWDETRLQVPHWALFDRLTISDDLRRAQDAAKQYSDEMVAALNEGGGEVTSKVNDGLEHFSATFDLTKNERRPVVKPLSWWERIRLWR